MRSDQLIVPNGCTVSFSGAALRLSRSCMYGSPPTKVFEQNLKKQSDEQIRGSGYTNQSFCKKARTILQRYSQSVRISLPVSSNIRLRRARAVWWSTRKRMVVFGSQSTARSLTTQANSASCPARTRIRFWTPWAQGAFSLSLNSCFRSIK